MAAPRVRSRASVSSSCGRTRSKALSSARAAPGARPQGARPAEPVRLLGVRLGSFEHVEQRERELAEEIDATGSPQLQFALDC